MNKTVFLFVGAVIVVLIFWALVHFGFKSEENDEVKAVKYVEDYEIIQKSDGTTVINPNW
ncbi:hypothetical protein KJ632_01225 [Patescibacteria group bacterium]|nr:hypothetical protein [Patescibacteria group bacterium]